MFNSTDPSPSEQSVALGFLQNLLQKHPFMFWGSLWAVMILVASVGAVGLFSPGSIESEVAPTATPAQTEDKVPVGLLSAIALTIAVGGTIAYQRQSKKPKRKSVSRTKPTPMRQKRRSPAVKKKAAPKVKERPPVMPLPNLQSPMLEVTILPPEPTRSQDWSNESLADVMDIRKRQTLGSLLRN